jgi:Zn-dependent protease/predicted transcriptional regulator
MSHPQQPARSDARQSWSFRIATVAGIPIRIHFTFVLFLAWVGISAGSSGGLAWTLFVIAIFFCVLLHELGHALVAKRLGVSTRDITLYPIGGVAMLDSRPKPRQELFISLAGPAVNLVLAAILFVALLVTNRGIPAVNGGLEHTSILAALLIANLTLAVFNMIPAFPMDGGRVLRAALGLKMTEAFSTQIAGGIGQGLAIIFGIVGLFTQGYILMLIAFFVFLGASQEVSSTVTRSFLHGHILSDAMQTSFKSLTSGESLQSAADMMIHGSQRDFPIMNGDEVIGVLTRNKVAEGLAADGGTGYVAGWMIRNFKVAEPDLPLEMALDMFPQNDTSPILIMQEETLIGMVTMETLSEFIMLEHAKARSRDAAI